MMPKSLRTLPALPTHQPAAKRARDTQFRLSLNGSELLTDSGQTLLSCGVSSGDLICVDLPESAAANPTNNTNSPNDAKVTANSASPTNTSTSSKESQRSTRQTAATTSPKPCSRSSLPAASSDSQRPDEVSSSDPSSSSWEPMLCSEAEEGQAPLSLELLYHSAQTSSSSDAVMVAAHQLMLETGFVPQGCELQSGEMPAGWRSAGGVYRLQYSHPLCENILVSVVALCMGPVLAINATLKVNESIDTIPKLTLNPRSYVTTQCPGESAAAAFKDLKKLSRVFKDQLAYPLIAAARAAMSLPVAFGLAALPPELLLRVLRLLDVVSVVRLSSVCRHFHIATADSVLWRHLYQRDFTDENPDEPADTDWKELYKRFHERRRCFLASSSFFNVHFLLPPPIPVASPLPSITGREYNQRSDPLPRPRFNPSGPL
ncbi:F-box only protein 7 [Xyrichtys novacula]|uniref:F-box only protein 7 n=1 Tax=Xyrichtys novacula TaxID=13765 RepID=A0AAV1F073_XYRNO|nr:F-box only protein 7 [Xyrichtys novacula]